MTRSLICVPILDSVNGSKVYLYVTRVHLYVYSPMYISYKLVCVGVFVYSLCWWLFLCVCERARVCVHIFIRTDTRA